MIIKKLTINASSLAGIATCAMVFAISIYLALSMDSITTTRIILTSFLFFIYVICFIVITDENLSIKTVPIEVSILAVQLLTTYLLLWLLPFTFLSILTIIWVSILPYYLSLRNSIFVALIVVISWFSLFAFRWNQNEYLTGILFLSFHFFSILMMYQTRKAQSASEETQRLNTELLATQHLLSEASRLNERTRIARDLHDLLGHHLTALIINLQVADHISEGEVKIKIEKCFSLAKLLMSDVREAVTTLRENETLDLNKMVARLVNNIPNLKIHNHIDATLYIENLTMADLLLKCIQEGLTNCIRHSGASEFWIILNEEDNILVLELYDNGQMQDNLEKGNGLIGMQERVRELNGSLLLQKRNNALSIQITLPLISKNE